MKLLYTTILFLTLFFQLSFGQQIFRRNASSPTGWQYNKGSGWVNMVLYPAAGGLGAGIGSITTSVGTVEGYIFSNSGATNDGAGLRITATSGVTVQYCLVMNGNSEGIYINSCSSVTIQYCLITNVDRAIRIEGDGTDNSIVVQFTQYLNIEWDEPAYGCCLGQFITLGNVHGTGLIFSDNRGENFIGEGYNEDLINTYASGGTSGSHMQIDRNIFRGGGQSTTGGGIIFGDNGSEYVDADANILVNPGWYGVQIFGGHDLTFSNNKIYSAEFPWSGTGILAYNGSGSCYNITIGTTNRVNWDRSPEIYGSPGKFPYDIYPSCGAITPPTTDASMLPTFASMGVPVQVVDYVSEDDLWYLRSLKWRYESCVDGAATYTVYTGPNPWDSRSDVRRPNANAGADQPSVTTTSTTLTSASTTDVNIYGNAFLTGKTSSLTGYRWVSVSGPNAPTIVSSTSSSTSVTGLITGTYIFRLEVEQTNNLWGLETYHADWVTVTVSTSAQTKYYISNGGSDAAAGTLAAPWLTIAKVNSSTFNPGDSIFFDKGDVWREQLTIPSSGAVNNRIVFAAYGSGAKPIINGADIKTGWVDGYNNINANIWGTGSTNAVTTRAMVVINGTIYAEVSAITGLTTPNTYFIKTASTPDSLYVYNTTDPDALTAEVSKREYCIVTAAGASSKRYIEIADLEVRYAGRAGIYFEGPGSGVGNALNGSSYVRRCFAYANRLFGVVNYDHYDSLVVEDSKATYNGNGFYSWQADEGTFRRDTTANQIHYEAISVFTDGGAIQGYQSDNWLAEYCYSDADYDAIHIDAGNIAVDATIRYNKVFNSRSGSPSTPGYGIGNTAAGSVINMYYNLAVNCASASQESSLVAHAGTINVYNNTFYHNTSTGTDGIVYFNHGTGYTFKNNLYVRDYVAGEFNFVVLNSPMSTNNYNNYYILNNVSGTLRNWYSGAAYTTMAAWRTATSQDANSITVDPLFVNVASDWSLQSGSPCRNAGVSVGLTQDINGNPIVGLPDIGAYELQTLRYKGRIF